MGAAGFQSAQFSESFWTCFTIVPVSIAIMIVDISIAMHIVRTEVNVGLPYFSLLDHKT